MWSKRSESELVKGKNWNPSQSKTLHSTLRSGYLNTPVFQQLSIVHTGQELPTIKTCTIKHCLLNRTFVSLFSINYGICFPSYTWFVCSVALVSALNITEIIVWLTHLLYFKILCEISSFPFLEFGGGIRALNANNVTEQRPHAEALPLSFAPWAPVGILGRAELRATLTGTLRVEAWPK